MVATLSPEEIPEEHRSGFEPGRWKDVPIEVYHTDPAISSSGLKDVDKSLRTYLHGRQETDDDPSAYQTFGRVAHKALLEPDKFDREHVKSRPPSRPGDKGWRSNHFGTAAAFADALDDQTIHRTGVEEVDVDQRKSIAEECPVSDGTVRKYMKIDGFEDLVEHFAHWGYDADNDLIDGGELERAIACRKAVLDTAAGDYLFRQLPQGAAEHSFWMRDPDTGIMMRVRPDWLVYGPNGWIVVDVKTTTDAGPFKFRRKVWRYGYHRQAAFYTDNLDAHLGPIARFVWCVVEKEPPHEVAFYEPEHEWVDDGRASYRAGLERLAEYYRDPGGTYLGIGDPDTPIEVLTKSASA